MADETTKQKLAKLTFKLIKERGFVTKRELEAALSQINLSPQSGTFTGYLNLKRKPHDSPFGEGGDDPYNKITKAGHTDGKKVGFCFRDFDDDIHTDVQYHNRIYMFTEGELEQKPRTKPVIFKDKDTVKPTVVTTEDTSTEGINQFESEVVVLNPVEDTEEEVLEGPSDRDKIRELLDRIDDLTPEDKLRILGGEGE
ncbi:hypothetical protein OAP41_04905 [Candidatus Poseidoniaceae archaeon]|nr:hypothetical protein [Candidatus Poseidoniaceae archaeon]